MGLDADAVLDLSLNPIGIRRGQIDLVDYRQYLQPLIDSGCAVGDTLRFDALSGIHNEQRTFAGCQGT